MSETKTLPEAIAEIHTRCVNTLMGQPCRACAVLLRAGRALAAQQHLLNDLHVIFTRTPAEIAERFGDSRLTDSASDSARINYALELMAEYVTEVTT